MNESTSESDVRISAYTLGWKLHHDQQWHLDEISEFAMSDPAAWASWRSIGHLQPGTNPPQSLSAESFLWAELTSSAGKVKLQLSWMEPATGPRGGPTAIVQHCEGSPRDIIATVIDAFGDIRGERCWELKDYRDIEPLLPGGRPVERRPAVRVGDREIVEVPTANDGRDLEGDDLRGGIIYVYHAGPFVKVGHTSRTSTRRMNEWLTGCPYNPKLLHEFPGSLQDEGRLHRALREWHQTREWFRAEDGALAVIDRFVDGRRLPEPELEGLFAQTEFAGD